MRQSVAQALDSGATHVTFTDVRGNAYIVPTAGLAYVEVGTEEARRVGFVITDDGERALLSVERESDAGAEFHRPAIGHGHRFGGDLPRLPIPEIALQRGDGGFFAACRDPRFQFRRYIAAGEFRNRCLRSFKN